MRHGIQQSAATFITKERQISFRKPALEKNDAETNLRGLIRLQALWLFFYAAVYVTYLPSYFQRLHYAPAYSTSYADAKFALLMELLRILMHIVAAMLIIQYTEPVMNYLLKDAKDEHEAAGE